MIEVPTIAIADPPDGGAALAAAVDHLDTYDWVVLTSTNGAGRFLQVLADRPAARQRPAVAVAVVGPGTAAAVRAAGMEPPSSPIGSWPRASSPPSHPAPAGCSCRRPRRPARCWPTAWSPPDGRSTAVVAYRTVTADAAPALIERARGADAITFTSGSTVTGYLAAAGAGAVPAVVACIGPVTAEAATAAGIVVTAVATEHTIDGLVAALEASLPT